MFCSRNHETSLSVIVEMLECECNEPIANHYLEHKLPFLVNIYLPRLRKTSIRTVYFYMNIS